MPSPTHYARLSNLLLKLLYHFGHIYLLFSAPRMFWLCLQYIFLITNPEYSEAESAMHSTYRRR